MNRQGNIISFDDARRLASAQSAYTGASRSSAAYPLYKNAVSDGALDTSATYAPADTFDNVSEFVSPFSSAPSQKPSSRSLDSVHSSASDSADFYSPFAYHRADYSGQSGRSIDLNGYSSVSSSGRISHIDGKGQDCASVRDAQRLKDPSRPSVRPAVEVYDEGLDDAQEDLRVSRHSKRGKRRTKAKAEKMFAKQFGSDSASAETGSRAAVYKGEMGRSHKRAFEEMGGSKRASSVTSSKVRASKKLRSSTASRITIVLGCLVCVVAVLLFLYPTAQQVYLESRERDRLQAEYDALVERNTALQERIDYLSTDEGIEDAAREELGWVQEGEIAVVVEGLSEDEETSIYTQIVSGSIATPETWYSPILDIVFGYTDPTTADDDDTSSSDDSSDDSSSDE